MTIEERAAQAAEWKAGGVCTCCQAVTLILADQTGLTEEQLRCISSGFAVSMGTMEGPCGALVGAVMVAGLKLGGPSVRFAKELAENFRRRTGSLICGELKGRDTGVLLCPCEECVRQAVLAYGDLLPL